MQYTTELMEKIFDCKNADGSSNEAWSDMCWRIISEVAPVYGYDYVMLWIFKVISKHISDMQLWTDEFKAQTVPNTATWSLPYWEKAYGLTAEASWTIEQRRQNVINKMWSSAPMNPKRLENFLSVTAGCPVEIQERTEDDKNRFTVWVQEVPSAVDEAKVRAQCSELKPAHLIFDVAYRVYTYGNLHIGGIIQTSKYITLSSANAPM